MQIMKVPEPGQDQIRTGQGMAYDGTCGRTGQDKASISAVSRVSPVVGVLRTAAGIMQLQTTRPPQNPGLSPRQTRLDGDFLSSLRSRSWAVRSRFIGASRLDQRPQFPERCNDRLGSTY